MHDICKTYLLFFAEKVRKTMRTKSQKIWLVQFWDWWFFCQGGEGFPRGKYVGSLNNRLPYYLFHLIPFLCWTDNSNPFTRGRRWTSKKDDTFLLSSRMESTFHSGIMYTKAYDSRIIAKCRFFAIKAHPFFLYREMTSNSALHQLCIV